jgi:valyl-tRNA synthetase
VSTLQGAADLVALLAKMETVEVVCGGEDPSPAGVGVAGTVEIFLPMKGLVDLDKEKARLEKDLAKLEGWMKGCRAKLGNEKFTANAPDHVVQQQKDLLIENENKAATLVERIKALEI